MRVFARLSPRLPRRLSDAAVLVGFVGIAVGVVGLGSVGCGPIVGGVQIINADIALSAARTAGAERTALYEYVAALEYLHKAREEQGYSDYWAARIYAAKALDLATRARKKAEATAAAEQPPAESVPVPPAPR